LSGRLDLQRDRGMLFAFREPTRPGFWMAGTTFPLAAIFLRADGTVVDVAWMDPLTLDLHAPSAPVPLVLEVRAETARAEGVRPGSRVQVVGPPR